ncbi:serine carboxypeptidase S28 family protein [Striga asiatica]|uniref:Serine carboxypeptidase S28 family protein n=1 Tax=Striga asiatica TaxID=4170 RepID=A0A5A7RDE9_STRAF|nr:serine carboxypeptidase S28 family protein [Striga asiatica]
MAVPPASRVVLSFRLFYPLLLLLLSSFLLEAEANFRYPRAADALRSSKRLSAFGGRDRNMTEPLPRGFKTYFYTQPFDHGNFEPDGYGTFKQKFVMNREYWAGHNSTAPMIFYFGSEGKLDTQDPGFVLDLCKNLSSILLAAWFRLKYPHIAAVAIASSAPIYYFDKNMNSHAYDQVITEDFKNVSNHCYRTIRKSWSKIDEIASEPDGLANLTQKFKTCVQLNKSSELKGFLVSMYSYAAQYNDPPNPAVNRICKGIDDASKKTNDVLDQVYEGIVSYFGNLTCYDMNHFDAPSETNDGWSWQTCSALMMHIGQGGKGSLFEGNQPYKLGLQKRRCMKMFNVTSRPYMISTQYGGLNLKLALKQFGSNLVFTNGLKDPYSRAGVLEDINESIVAITTQNGSHALDMVAPTESDPSWLVDQRNKVVQTVQKWLDQYYADLTEYLKNN